MYLIKMTDENGDVFYKNHAYRDAWGSWDMAQQYTDRELAVYEANEMTINGDDLVEIESF